MTTLTEGNYPGEFLAEYFSDRFNFEEVTVEVPTGANMTITEEQVLGMPLKDNGGTWEWLRGADSANVDAFAIKGPGTDGAKAAATSSGPYLALVRGPAVIVSDLIQADDGSGVAFTAATILANLPEDIVARSHAAVSETQDT